MTIANYTTSVSTTRSVVSSQLPVVRSGDAALTTDNRLLTARTAVVSRVGIIGATGYAGSELVRILEHHPHAEIIAAGGSDMHLDAVRTADVVFLATPNEASAKLAPKILDAGARVIDLSGAWRLSDAALYPSWYGFEHERPELLDEAVYGLTEWCNGELTNARLVANPGCYPTSILLALRPLTFLLDRTQAVVCDAKSGVSGAGKKAELDWSFAEVAGNFKAYGIGKHRHEPEIRRGLHLGDRAPLVFVPHLLPTVRGILSTMHVAFTRPLGAHDLAGIYNSVYGDKPFVRILPPGQLPELKHVVNTPRCDIGFVLLDGGHRAVIVSVIDNLLKGAASQAVQNFNQMCGYDEREGLS